MAEDARKIGADGTTGARSEQLVQKFSPLPTGTRLGEMTVQSVLGAGELGITYITRHEASNRRFVLKEYMPRAIAFRDGLTVRVSAASTPAFAWGLDRFLSEGKTLAKIKHPAIVGVQAASEGNGTGYVVMTHETGRDLAVWLHELRRAPTQGELDQLVKALLEGIALLHDKAIQHLEIMPANILIRDNGSPVLIDFGAVRVALRRRLEMPAPEGAKAFMAPEVVAGDQGLIGPASDIYALAAVLYLAVTGAAPPPSDKRALRDELAPARTAAKAKLRTGFLAAIDAGLQFRPDERPRQVATWLEELMRTDEPGSAGRKQEAGNAAGSGEGQLLPMEPKRLYSYPEAEAAENAAKAGAAHALMEDAGFRSLFFGALGGVCGGIAGALSSVVIASVVWSSCYTDACVAPVLPFTAAIGALAGIYFGMQYGKSSAPHQPLPPSTDDA